MKLIASDSKIEKILRNWTMCIIAKLNFSNFPFNGNFCVNFWKYLVTFGNIQLESQLRMHCKCLRRKRPDITLWPYFLNFVQKLWHTAIPYRVSTGPEQGFPCVLFPNREKPVFITGIAANENRFFPVGKSTQGNPCFHYRDGFAV